ncbi:MAG: O-antigen ligase family protein [Candidatus Pacebacteria bacterium]|nr:O-antigen ligase family protein [Candidatus Paceibacterota bacterium]
MGKRSREKKERREEEVPIPEAEVSESPWTSFLKLIIFIGIGFILFTPFIIGTRYFFPFVGPKSIYFMAFVEIIFAAWLILIFSAPRYRPKFNALLVALIIYLAVFSLSSYLGVDFIRSFWSKFERMTGLLMQIHLFAFFLVVSSVFQKKKDWIVLFGISIVAAILMSIMNLLPKISENFLSTSLMASSRGGATIGNSSFLGTYLLFNLFFALYLFINSKKDWIKIFSGFGIIIIGWALLFSTARAAIYSTAGGLFLLFILWMIFSKAGNLKLIGISLLAILAIFSLVVLVFSIRPNNYIHKLVVEDFFGETFGGRFIVWKGAWKSFLEKPFLGWGPENFELAFTKNYDACMGTPRCGSDVWYDRAHNIVFDTLVTTGIFGFLSYLGLFAAVFYILWKQFAKQNINFWTAGIFSVTLIAYFIQNLTVFDMVNSYMLFFLTLGFIGSISQTEPLVFKKESFNFWIILIVLPLLSFSLIKFVKQPLSSDGDIIKAINAQVGSKERKDLYTKTLENTPMGKYQIRDFFAQSLSEFIQGGKYTDIPVEDMKGEVDYITGELEKSVKESPLDFRSYLKLGQIYNSYYSLFGLSVGQRAEEVLTKAIEIGPNNQQGYWALAQTKIYEKKITEALALAEKAQNLEPKLKTSYLILVQVAKIAGDTDLANKKIEEAIKIDPSWEAELKAILAN